MSVSILDGRDPFILELAIPAEVIAGVVQLTTANLGLGGSGGPGVFTTVNISGTLSVAGISTLGGVDCAALTCTTLAPSGNVSVGSGRFTVAAATGNTAIAGDFSIASTRFTVAAATGNTAIAGTLDVTGDVAVNTNKVTIDGPTGNTLIAGTLATTGVTTMTGGFTSAGALAYIGSDSFAVGAANVIVVDNLTNTLSLVLPTYADNAAALLGGLVATNMYKTATGEVRIVV